VQNRRLWVRLHEKGGKQHEMPCHHILEEYLDAYLDAGGLRNQPRSPLFRTIGRGTGVLTGPPPAPSECLRDDPATGGGFPVPTRRITHDDRLKAIAARSIAAGHVLQPALPKDWAADGVAGSPSVW
jgi:hypothetical protein